MVSAAASGTLASLALLLVCSAVLLSIRYWVPLRSAPSYLTLSIFLAVALPLSSIILLPIDLASSARIDDEAAKGIWLPQRLILVSWRLVYWIGFVLMWVILPLLGEYMDSGYRDPHQRIMYSLRSNGRYQLITLSCAVLGLIYMCFSYGFDFTAIKGLIIALAYVWGLFLAIALMGHGLVAVPRTIMRNASISGRLRRVQAHAPRVHEKLEDAVINLEEVEGQIEQLKKRKTGTARDFQDWIDDLADMIGTAPPRLTLATPDLDSSVTIPAVITERYLADLTRRFHRARHQRARYVEEWDHIVRTANDLQLILDAKASKKLTFSHPQSSSATSRLVILTPTLRYFLHANILPALRLALGAFLSLASAAIILSEILRFPAPRLSPISLTVIHTTNPSTHNYRVGLGGQAIAALWILYMCTATLSSISSIPVWNQRALVHRNTSSESAAWYAGQIARLTVPLAYNFLTFLPANIHENTVFYNFLGKLINLTPLGEWFENLFPMFVLVPACATLFNLYGRIKTILGFGIIEDDEEENPSGFGTGGWREGRDLIARDLNGPAGGGSSSLGLLSSQSSPRTSTDATRPPRWASPARQPATGRTVGNPSPLNPNAPRPSRARQPNVLDPEPEEENFFTLFGRRVRNTFETFEAPKWVYNNNDGARSNGAAQSSSSNIFSRPKWMGGDDSGDERNLFDRLFNNTASGQGPNRGSGNSGRIVL